MRPSDRESFAQAIESLAANFRVEPTEALLEGYWRGLRDLPLDVVERAVERALRESRHMPRAVELRELGGDMPPALRAVQAWSALQRAIGQHGVYRSIDFDDPLINATVRNLGGWQRLCGLSVEEAEKWTRKDFERIYTALFASGVTDEQVKHLPGVHEQSNTGLGYPVAPPVRVACGLPALPEGKVRMLEAGKPVLELVDGLAKSKGVA